MHAAAAEGFNADAAAAYERGRPGYVSAHINAMLRAGLADLPPSSTSGASSGPALWPALPVLELGAGTGKMSRPLVAELTSMAPPGIETQPNVILSDPAGMAAALSGDSTLASRKFLKARADDLSCLADGSVCLVTAGQAFHWFAEPVSLGEIARVLAPGGVFAPVWNIWDLDKGGAWLRAFDELIGSYYPPTTPRQCTGLWRKALAECPLFHPMTEMHLPQDVPFEGDEDHFITYAFSLSEIARLSADGKAAVADRIRQLLRKEDTPHRVDASGKRIYSIPLLTQIAIARKASHPPVAAGGAGSGAAGGLPQAAPMEVGPVPVPVHLPRVRRVLVLWAPGAEPVSEDELGAAAAKLGRTGTAGFVAHSQLSHEIDTASRLNYALRITAVNADADGAGKGDGDIDVGDEDGDDDAAELLGRAAVVAIADGSPAAMEEVASSASALDEALQLQQLTPRFWALVAPPAAAAGAVCALGAFVPSPLSTALSSGAATAAPGANVAVPASAPASVPPPSLAAAIEAPELHYELDGIVLEAGKASSEAVVNGSVFTGVVRWVVDKADVAAVDGDTLAILMLCSKEDAVEALSRCRAGINLTRSYTAHIQNGRCTDTPYAIAEAWLPGKGGVFAAPPPEGSTVRIGVRVSACVEWQADPLRDVPPLEIDPAVVAVVGGKAAGLRLLDQTLRKLSLPRASVPQFTSISTRQIKRWLAAAAAARRGEAASSSVVGASGGEAAASDAASGPGSVYCRATFEALALEWVEDQFIPDAEACGLGGVWAVRSSADAEDSGSDAMAGTFDSVLNVRTADLHKAIATVTWSLFNNEMKLRQEQMQAAPTAVASAAAGTAGAAAGAAGAAVTEPAASPSASASASAFAAPSFASMAVVIQRMVTHPKVVASGAVFIPFQRDSSAFIIEGLLGRTAEGLMDGKASANASVLACVDDATNAVSLRSFDVSSAALRSCGMSADALRSGFTSVAQQAWALYLATGRGDMEYVLDSSGGVHWVQSRINTKSALVEVSQGKKYHPAGFAYTKSIAFNTALSCRMEPEYFRVVPKGPPENQAFSFTHGIRRRDWAFHKRVQSDVYVLADVTRFGWRVDRLLRACADRLASAGYCAAEVAPGVSPLDVLKLLSLHGAVQSPFPIPVDSRWSNRSATRAVDAHPTLEVLPAFLRSVFPDEVPPALFKELWFTNISCVGMRMEAQLKTIEGLQAAALAAGAVAVAGGTSAGATGGAGASVDLTSPSSLAPVTASSSSPQAASLAPASAALPHLWGWMVDNMDRGIGIDERVVQVLWQRARDAAGEAGRREALAKQLEVEQESCAGHWKQRCIRVAELHAIAEAAGRGDEFILWSAYLSMKSFTNEAHDVYRSVVLAWAAARGISPDPASVLQADDAWLDGLEAALRPVAATVPAAGEGPRAPSGPRGAGARNASVHLLGGIGAVAETGSASRSGSLLPATAAASPGAREGSGFRGTAGPREGSGFHGVLSSAAGGPSRSGSVSAGALSARHAWINASGIFGSLARSAVEAEASPFTLRPGSRPGGPPTLEPDTFPITVIERPGLYEAWIARQYAAAPVPALLLWHVRGQSHFFNDCVRAGLVKHIKVPGPAGPGGPSGGFGSFVLHPNPGYHDGKTVTYHLRSGTKLFAINPPGASADATSGDRAVFPPTAKSGYAFIAWWLTPALGEELDATMERLRAEQRVTAQAQAQAVSRAAGGAGAGAGTGARVLMMRQPSEAVSASNYSPSDYPRPAEYLSCIRDLRGTRDLPLLKQLQKEAKAWLGSELKLGEPTSMYFHYPYRLPYSSLHVHLRSARHPLSEPLSPRTSFWLDWAVQLLEADSDALAKCQLETCFQSTDNKGFKLYAETLPASSFRQLRPGVWEAAALPVPPRSELAPPAVPPAASP